MSMILGWRKTPAPAVSTLSVHKFQVSLEEGSIDFKGLQAFNWHNPELLAENAPSNEQVSVVE